jgi:serine/threonine protein phosphatase PrpC
VAPAPDRGSLDAQLRLVPRFDFRVDLAHATERGPIRAENQDRSLDALEAGLFGIADGVGGLASGGDAAELALATVRSELATKEVARVLEGFAREPTLARRRRVFDALRATATAAQARVREEASSRGVAMATTLDFCVLVRDAAFVAHTGDGRVYLARPRATTQLTTDHVQAGRLASAIGLEEPPRIDVLYVELGRGDALVAMTDGAYAALDDENELATIARASASQAARALVQRALDQGGRDNASAIVARVGDRFLARPGSDGEKSRAPDARAVASSPLLDGLAPSVGAAVTSIGVEVELAAGAPLPRIDAGDRCAYLVLDGVLRLSAHVALGTSALVFAEALVGVDAGGHEPVVAEEPSRLLRLRHDDFRELCGHDAATGRALYERLAHHLARTR